MASSTDDESDQLPTTSQDPDYAQDFPIDHHVHHDVHVDNTDDESSSNVRSI